MLKKIGSLVLLFMVCAPAWGDPAIALKVLEKSFVAGRPFDAVLLVNGAECSEPEWAGAGFDVVRKNSEVVGEGEDATHSFNFRLLPLRNGPIALPTFMVLCDEYELESIPTIVSVQKPRESSDLTLKSSVSEIELFVGQPTRLTVDWKIEFDPRNLRAVMIMHPTQYLPSLDVSDMVPAGEKMGLPVEDRRLMAAIIKTDDATTYRFEQLIVPKDAGVITLPATHLIASRIKHAQNSYGQSVPSYFDNNFFNEVESRDEFSDYFAESKPLKLKVKPLPPNTTEMPFSGIVGPCELTVEPSSTEVLVGEPFALTIRIKTPFPQTTRLPDLREFDALQRRFWIPETQSTGRAETGERVYIQSVRALHTGVQMVPPLELLIFNPKTAEYERVRSKAIALSVQPNAGETRFIAPSAGNTLTERTVNMEGIWFNQELAAGWLDRTTIWAAEYWYVWLLLPVLLGLFIEPIARRHRLFKKDPKRAVALRAYSRFRRRLSRDPLEAVLQTYLGERFDLQSGTITCGDLIPIFKEHSISAATADALSALMTAYDRAQFGRGAELKDARKNAAKIIRKIESEVS